MIGREEKSRAGDTSRSDFEELFESRLKELQEGDIAKGRVVQITQDSVMIDIGYKSEGQVPLREFLDKDGQPTIKVGDEVAVLIERREDENGIVRLSKAKADHFKVWDRIVEACEKSEPMEGTISQRIKGGFYADIEGVTAFLPGSQVDLKPVRNPDKLIGQRFKFRILKYNRRKNNVIVSRRVLLEEEREVLRKTTLETLAEGATVEGTVKNITDYGAFIDLGGIDGLVHLTDLSWGKVTHPSQLLKIGDTVKVMVLKFNREENKISLGMKQTVEDPWIKAGEKFTPGTRTTGTVVNITDYGAFVELEPGLEGLVHISEMSWTKLKHPSQKVKVGDRVEVEVIDLDPASKRISLGMKQTESNPWIEAEGRYPKGSRVSGVVKNITDFGVFIGIEEGIDGLVHISDLSWKKVKHPSELFRKGQEVEAVVLNIDAANRRFSLSTKLLEKNPWQGVEERYKPGMIVDGKVTSVADFGAFVELEAGLEGLVHVSELSRGKKRGADIKEGDIVEVEVLNVDPEDNKIGLSVREVKSQAEPAGDGNP
ncbi:MAG: 30S ribosomal protein S1 [Thermodesulfobacteriota bacterium]|nr:MAG: 30S ribosomal protein S1 [Thermodesulfobacteriota bacterium]